MFSSTAPWARRPAPQPEESFTSWFVRLAWANGLTAAELYAAAMPGARLYHLDLDRFADPMLLGELAARTGRARANIANRTLRHWLGRLYGDDDGIAKLVWLPPAGTSLSRRSFGQQICTACLREDAVPHLRLTWRLSFAPACPKHKRLLLDRCPRCVEPIQPLYAPAHAKKMGVCWNCGLDLHASKTDRVTTADIGIQQTLVQAARDRWLALGAADRVHSMAGFRVLWMVYRLLATGRFAYPLRRWLADRALTQEPVAGIPRIKEVERLIPRHRMALLSMTWALLQDWPERFVTACEDVGITSRVIVKDRRETPFALWVVATQRLCDPPREVTADELAAAKRVLVNRGVEPTYAALVDLMGVKFTAHQAAAVPSTVRKPCGTDRYWKLDGISASVRAAAKQAARRQGENVGPWVERALREVLAREQLL